MKFLSQTVNYFYMAAALVVPAYHELESADTDVDKSTKLAALVMSDLAKAGVVLPPVVAGLESLLLPKAIEMALAYLEKNHPDFLKLSLP